MVCLRSAKSRLVLRQLKCQDRSAQHALHRAGPVLFCSICGAYAEKRSQGLSEECKPFKRRAGTLVKDSRYYRLQNLLKGCHPKTGLRLGPPALLRKRKFCETAQLPPLHSLPETSGAGSGSGAGAGWAGREQSPPPDSQADLALWESLGGFPDASDSDDDDPAREAWWWVE